LIFIFGKSLPVIDAEIAKRHAASTQKANAILDDWE
jgi:hypothetical protein